MLIILISLSPVTRISLIWVLIALASMYNLFIHEMDVKTTFLNGGLEEEIYMLQPEDCIVPGQKNKVCKLLKSLYGLKQALKQWHEKFNQVILSDGFSLVNVDKWVYTKSIDNEYVIISLYLDDMLVFSTSMNAIYNTKRFLASKFDMKDMGETSVILGIKIIRKDYGIMLT